jgi:hypothetical protein
MTANFNDAITINVSASPGKVFTEDFGILCHATDQLGAGFTETIRVYEGKADVSADSDLLTAAAKALNDAFSQNPRLRKIVVGKVIFGGTPALSGELDAVRVAAIGAGANFYFLDIGSRVESDILAAAAWMETEFGAFGGQTSDAAVLAGTAGNVLEDLAGFAYTRTFCAYHHDDTENLAMAIMAKVGGADPDQQATIWRHQPLTAMTISSVTSTEKSTVLGNQGNLYLPFFGIATFGEGTLADGNKIDTRIAQDWLESRLQAGIAQLLVDRSAANLKVPYTDKGLDAVANEIDKVLGRGVAVEHFAEGAKIDSYPTRATTPAGDITARTATYPLTLEFAGAVEEVTVNAVVTL